nr:putative disease resistance RPP13-like protein 1 [Arachis hypogaea]
MVFLPLPLNGWSFDYYLSNKVIYDLLPKLKQLRVLSLSHYKNISELPDSVGALKHLRHLDLSGTNIKRLPSVVCKLYNLQSLLLSDCKFLTELPEEIAMLVNLRHLDLSGTQLQEIPAQIARLENLQTLSGFVVSRQQNGLKVGELQKFPNLQGKLCISKLEKIVDSCDASQANMKKKEQIEDLSLEWDSCTGQESQHLVLEHLQPSTNLNKPTIKFYGGTWFPNWLGNSSFANMVYLCINPVVLYLSHNFLLK